MDQKASICYICVRNCAEVVCWTYKYKKLTNQCFVEPKSWHCNLLCALCSCLFSFCETCSQYLQSSAEWDDRKQQGRQTEWLAPQASKVAAYLRFKGHQVLCDLSRNKHHVVCLCEHSRVLTGYGTNKAWLSIGWLNCSRLVSGPGSFNQISKVLEFILMTLEWLTLCSNSSLRGGFDWRPRLWTNNSVRTFNLVKKPTVSFSDSSLKSQSADPKAPKFSLLCHHVPAQSLYKPFFI